MNEIANVGVIEGKMVDFKPPAESDASLYDVLNVNINKVVLRVRGRVTALDAARRLLKLVETERNKYSGTYDLDLADVSDHKYLLIQRSNDVLELCAFDSHSDRVVEVLQSSKMPILDRAIEFLNKIIEVKTNESQAIALSHGRAISSVNFMEKLCEPEALELTREESELPQLKIFKPKGTNIPGNNRSMHNKVKPGKFFNKNKTFRSSGRGR